MNYVLGILCENSDRFSILKEYHQGGVVKIVIFNSYTSVLDSASELDILILDGDTKGFNINQVCELFAMKLDIPMLMLSNDISVDSEKRAFDMGCVDYIRYPFNIEILMRRVNLQVKLSRKSEPTIDLVLPDNISFDRINNTVYNSELPIPLTNIQFRMLNHFVLNPDRIISRIELLKVIWGDKLKNERVVDTHIKNLRKLVPEIKIDTVSGCGYRARLEQ